MDSPIKISRPIEICEYSKRNLLELFERGQTISKVTKKTHVEYFNEYLLSKDMGAKTIVVENDYIDRDFLEDFSAYYVRCFRDYKRKKKGKGPGKKGKKYIKPSSIHISCS